MKQLIAITTPTLFEGESACINALFEHGLMRLHLRKPDASEDAIGTLLKQISSEYHPRIVLHDAFGLTQHYKIGGLHLNRRNGLPLEQFQGSISRSCHSLEELEVYKTYDYLFLSPIFNSISKEGYGSTFSPAALQEAEKAGLITSRVIALGGMDVATIKTLQASAFGGVAVLGALWKDIASTEVTDVAIQSLIERFELLKSALK
jgi:thiamine-phosphate pyrophosphorylase